MRLNLGDSELVHRADLLEEPNHLGAMFAAERRMQEGFFQRHCQALRLLQPGVPSECCPEPKEKF